jgi:nicotinamide riboside kinase
MTQMPKAPICISLMAGPGAGKSTLCAEVFAKLKWAGVNCEMATEYAKDKVWEGSFGVLENQLYVFGKQQHRIFRLREQVDVIVTDSPLFYDKSRNPHLRGLVLEEFAKCYNLTYLLSRRKAYNPKGRMQTEAEAEAIDVELRAILDAEQIPYKEMVADQDAAGAIVESVLKALGK